MTAGTDRRTYLSRPDPGWCADESSPPAGLSHEEPPRELLRFSSLGRRWAADDFAAFVRAHVAWRDTHVEPLPSLPALERARMLALDLPAALVDAENQAPRKPPEWRRRQLGRGITDPRQVLSEG